MRSKTELNSNQSNIQLLNPVWKSFARYLTAKCEKCGQERLLSVFDKHSGSSHYLCSSCLLASTTLLPLIVLLFHHLDVDRRTTIQMFDDKLVRKCMLSIVKGIAQFGIEYPQPAGAPITIVWNFTNRCNLDCLHCHQDSSPLSSEPELRLLKLTK